MTTQNNNDLEKLIQPDTDTKNPDADVIANLEKEKEELKDDRLEERFLWIVVCIVMVDFAFFANISHELRTPLTLILGPLSSILERPEELTPQLLAQHRIMNRNGKKLLELIEEILDLSKLDAHKLKRKSLFLYTLGMDQTATFS